MNLLRDELHRIADEAPQIDLADRALKGAKRGRAITMALAVVIAVAVLTGGMVTVVNGGLRGERPVVLTPVPAVAPVLPKKDIGPLARAYTYFCPPPTIDDTDCVDGQWRVVTASGMTYKLTAALGLKNTNKKVLLGPVAITQNGRRIAYYSEKQQTFEVRDLRSGRIWKAPFTISKNELAGENFLRLSPNGLHLLYANFGGRSKPYSVLVDVAEGKTTTLNGTWLPVSVDDDGGSVTQVMPYDGTTRIRVLGNEPLTIKEATHSFSALGPDGRTLARIGSTRNRDAKPELRRPRTIVTIDAIGGHENPEVPIQGIPEELVPSYLGGWVGDTEVTLLAVPELSGSGTPALYVLDVHTGRTRQLRTLDSETSGVLPGMVG
ncbi:hypothetical protein [Streptosporangium amethystogenes]|uniref:hypothetical protein n=1 Tax=Streptosporangium amethystogenes TaxID=2002 RepID=UPI0004CA2285|nr:hypothetical protein [Streptosporangium amethystogenes]